jgi:hypothetical protein
MLVTLAVSSRLRFALASIVSASTSNSALLLVIIVPSSLWKRVEVRLRFYLGTDHAALNRILARPTPPWIVLGIISRLYLLPFEARRRVGFPNVTLHPLQLFCPRAGLGGDELTRGVHSGPATVRDKATFPTHD